MNTYIDSPIARAMAVHGARSDEFRAALADGGYTAHASGLFAETFDPDSGDLHECPTPDNPEMITTVFCIR